MGFDAIKERISSIQIRSDKVIWILVMLFAMVSVLAIFSASSYLALSGTTSKVACFTKQLKFACGGIVALLVCYFIPLKWYRSLAIIFYAGSLVLLCLAMVIGEDEKGAQRSIKLLGVSIHVLEFAKVGLIFYLAKALEMWEKSLNTARDYILKLVLPIGATCLLVLFNSASSAIFFGGLSLLILFLMEVNGKYVGLTLLAALGAMAILIGAYKLYEKHQPSAGGEKTIVDRFFQRFETSRNRIVTFIEYDIKETKIVKGNLTREEYEKLLQKTGQSRAVKAAIYEGKITGKGPGKGSSRYNLPDGYDDLIYAVIINDYGLIGGVGLLFLYLLFLFRGIRIAQKCSTPFPQALALGISWLIGIQAMLHILVSVRLLPITGHTLPFISRGGTAFMLFCGCAGVLLSVSKQINMQQTVEETTGTDTNEQNESYEGDY